MPTTILDGETYPEALHRRYAEEAKVEERMKTKYTPGPWQAHPMEMNYGLPYTPVAANTLLAKVYSEAFGDHEQSEANARLIAAAPELLEELNQMIRAYVRLLEAGRDRIRDLGGECDGIDKMEADDPNLRAAKAVIAKATGGGK